MQTETLLFILLAILASAVLVWLQYYYKDRRKGRRYLLLSALRFIALFGLFLLLINPQFTKNELSLEKADLIVLIDNSSSIKEHGGNDQSRTIGNALINNKDLAEKFNVKEYSFGADLNDSSAVSFTEKSTNIAKALTTVSAIYGTGNRAIILLTDGNQTIGTDYEYNSKDQKFPVYPIAVGDTTTYQDLRIDRINSNTYAFLKNTFPIEIFVSYSGLETVSTGLTVSVDGKVAYKENLRFSGTSTSKIVTTLLDANTIGVKNITVKVAPFSAEKNIFNNEKQLTVEVIDEKTNIAIVSDMVHPDIAALKKAIESNEQRSVTLYKSNTAPSALENADVFILYQPNAAFKDLYNYIDKKQVNTFTITGSKTDWRFLNSIQSSFEKTNYNQIEELSPVRNDGFSTFDISNVMTAGFPPLEGTLGEITLKKQSTPIFTQRIRGVEMKEPLLSVIGDGTKREAVLFGEHIWKWRIQDFRNHQNFENFDDFIGKLILYLSVSQTKNQFNLDYKALYQGSGEASITATYFDKTFVFDGKANIILQLTEKSNGKTTAIPMRLKGNYFEADLSNLDSGSYNFTATVMNENVSKSGGFTIQDFDIEKQFLSTNYLKLERLAHASKGALYFPAEVDTLVNDLLANEQFIPTQRSKLNVVSLIDFRVLLAIIIAALGLEWFIRKYNGLI